MSEANPTIPPEEEDDSDTCPECGEEIDDCRCDEAEDDDGD